MNKLSLLLLGFLVYGGWSQKPAVITVNGPIEPENVGYALTHEHIMSNFGAEPEQVGRYDEKALMDQVVPYLKKVKSMGVTSIFEATAAYFGRNVVLMQRISDTTGIQIISNTGFYGAANDRYVPAMAFEATAEEIAKLWIDEFEQGIEGTEIRPGFVKLAFDVGEPSEIDLKLFEAGILTHLKTGLTLAVHTGDNPEAVRSQLTLLESYNVSANAWIWIHANKSDNKELLLRTASAGAWVSLDGVNASNVDEYIRKINWFRENKLLDRVLLSHDGNSFPSGGEIREFQAIPQVLVPKMREQGYSDSEIEQLTIENPAEAYGIRIRKR